MDVQSAGAAFHWLGSDWGEGLNAPVRGLGRQELPLPSVPPWTRRYDRPVRWGSVRSEGHTHPALLGPTMLEFTKMTPELRGSTTGPLAHHPTGSIRVVPVSQGAAPHPPQSPGPMHSASQPLAWPLPHLEVGIILVL